MIIMLLLFLDSKANFEKQLDEFRLQRLEKQCLSNYIQEICNQKEFKNKLDQNLKIENDVFMEISKK